MDTMDIRLIIAVLGSVIGVSLGMWLAERKRKQPK